MVALTNVLEQAWVVILVPVWAVQHGHSAATVGILLATMSGGAIVGSLVAMTAGARIPRLWAYTIGFLVAGPPRFAILALDPGMGTILTVVALSGLAGGVLNPIISAVEFERIPESLVGRVSSLITTGAWSLMPFGGLLGSAIAAVAGVGPAMYAVGLSYLVVSLAPLTLPSFRALNRSVDNAGHAIIDEK